jgi:hypothetical protein
MPTSVSDPIKPFFERSPQFPRYQPPSRTAVILPHLPVNRHQEHCFTLPTNLSSPKSFDDTLRLGNRFRPFYPSATSDDKELNVASSFLVFKAVTGRLCIRLISHGTKITRDHPFRVCAMHYPKHTEDHLPVTQGIHDP